MSNNVDYKRVLTISDIATAIIIIVGFLIASFVEDISFKVIGISLAILGIVRLILFIVQRVNMMIAANKLRPKTPPPDFKVTEKKDKKAKRTVIEGFTAVAENKDKPHDDFTKEIRDEEGFRVITNQTPQINDGNELELETTQNIPEKQELKININSQAVVDFEDEISSFKIFSKEIDQKKEDNMEEKIETIEQPNQQITELPGNSISYKGKTIDIPLSELMEVEPAFGLEPRKEFEYYLSRVLKVIRSVTTTKSAVFVLVNSDRKELIIEAFDSEVPGKIASRKRIPFGNDIVTQIVDNLKPEILTDINPTAELDLIPYYLQQVGTSSFFGMPVFFNDAIVGVICVDSDENNAYDTSIVGLFGQFAKLISSLVKSYTDKYDLMQDSKTLESINKFRNMLKESDFTINKIYDSLLDAIHDSYDNCVSGIIGYNAENNWEIQLVRNSNYPFDVELGTIIDNNRSLAGQTLTRNRVSTSIPLRINDFRFSSKEQKISEGYFISVPLSSLSNVYGAMFLQGINSGDITQYDINIFSTLASHAGSTIEQIHFADVLKKSALFDISTGLLNTPAFTLRLNEEVLRSSDFGYPMTLCLIEIDKYKAFDPALHQDRHEMVLMHVVDIIHGKIRPYDLFGRAESNIFGVVLIDIDTKNAKSWAEKLRSEIAISVLKINQDSFTVTVSIGVAQLGKDEAIEDVFSNAKEMLKLSKQKTNTVTIFE